MTGRRLGVPEFVQCGTSELVRRAKTQGVERTNSRGKDGYKHQLRHVETLAGK